MMKNITYIIINTAKYFKLYSWRDVRHTVSVSGVTMLFHLFVIIIMRAIKRAVV